MSKPLDAGFRIIPYYDQTKADRLLNLDVKCEGDAAPTTARVPYQDEDNLLPMRLPLPRDIAGLTGHFNRDELAEALEKLATALRGKK